MRVCKEWRVQTASLGRAGEQRAGTPVLTRVSPEWEGLCHHGQGAQLSVTPQEGAQATQHERSEGRKGRGETEAETERQTDPETETYRETEVDRQKHRGRDRETDTHKEKREIETESHTEG